LVIIHAAKFFACAHTQYAALQGKLICVDCELRRDKIPMPSSDRQSLMFFPTSVMEQERALLSASGTT
jgi:hypothetical protein